MDFGFGFGFGFSAIQLIFYIIFAIVIGGFIVTAVRGIRTWHKNNNSPRLTVQASEHQRPPPSHRQRRHAHLHVHLLLRDLPV